MVTARRCLGNEVEELALRFLKQKGYKIIARNYRTRYGELDLVTKFRDRIVFIEVKTRKTHTFGSPEQAIDYRKQRHLALMAKWYMMEQKRKEAIFQIDCLAIDLSHGRGEISHLENIVQDW